MQKEVPAIAEELTNLLSQVKGVKKVSEELTLSYLCVIGSEEDREGVEKVGVTLADQARKYGFVLDIIPVTEEEVKVAKDRMAEHLAQNTTFKS